MTAFQSSYVIETGGQSPPAKVFTERRQFMVKTKHIPREWKDFEAAARRPIEQHIRNSFIHTYKPVLDDAEYRSFDTMEEYRRWCKKNLPAWLGYNRE